MSLLSQVCAACGPVTRTVKNIPRPDGVLFSGFLPFDLYGMNFTILYRMKINPISTNFDRYYYEAFLDIA